MIATVHPGRVGGKLSVPASKSMQQRVCALALLNRGITRIYGSGNSNDEKTALEIIFKLGAKVYTEDNVIVIESDGKPVPTEHLSFNESGLSLRMFTPIAVLSPSRIQLNGNGSLSYRNMDGFIQTLKQLGIKVQDESNHLPFSVEGPLVYNSSIAINAGDSSQFVSGLLMALSFKATQTIYIDLINPVSKPYIDLTIEMMKAFGHRVERTQDFKQIIINPGASELKGDREITIEGDWSHGALLLVIGALTGGICLSGLKINSVQADRKILEVLTMAGVNIIEENDCLSVNETKEVNPFVYDAMDCPDLFPALVLLASRAKGVSCISGVHRLWHKESNRATALVELFSKLGVQINIEGDDLIIHGKAKLSSARVQSYQDHRMVMVAAAAGLIADGPVEISGAEAIDKSYPDFFTDLRKLGANVNKQTN